MIAEDLVLPANHRLAMTTTPLRLNTLMTKLDLRDAVLVGFSMGTGEVTLSRQVWLRACAESSADGSVPPSC